MAINMDFTQLLSICDNFSGIWKSHNLWKFKAPNYLIPGPLKPLPNLDSPSSKLIRIWKICQLQIILRMKPLLFHI